MLPPAPGVVAPPPPVPADDDHDDIFGVRLVQSVVLVGRSASCVIVDIVLDVVVDERLTSLPPQSAHPPDVLRRVARRPAKSVSGAKEAGLRNRVKGKIREYSRQGTSRISGNSITRALPLRRRKRKRI